MMATENREVLLEHIEVNGGGSAQKREVKRLAEWLIYRLLTPRTAHQIYLEIDLVRHLVTKTGEYGSCDTPWHQGETRYPKAFKIELASNVPMDTLLETLCHECIHLYQYATGKLEELSRRPVFRYAGSHYPVNMNYWKQPWEIEAHERSRPLLEEYYSHKSS